MRPIGIKEKQGKTIFIYRFRDLRGFIMQGRDTGDVGMIIISRDDNGMIKYRGFGTIEHPNKEIMTIVIKQCELFDGRWNPSKIIIPSLKVAKQSHRTYLLNLS
jgi:hypothetical protein